MAENVTIPSPDPNAAAAAYLNWNSDFLIDDIGRTILADPDTAFIQRLMRRLLTSPRFVDARSGKALAPPDYLASPTFGAGLRRAINRTIDIDEIQRIVLAQILADPETDQSFRPQIQIAVDPGPGLVQMQIRVRRTTSSIVVFGVRLRTA